MKIISLVDSSTVQYCPHCLYEQQNDQTITMPYFGERNERLLGLCEEHGPFELEEVEDYVSQEQSITQNFLAMMMGTNLGHTIMVLRKNDNGDQEYMIGLRRPDGTLQVIAKMLSALENEILTPNR